MTKSVTFTEYRIAEKNNEGKNSSEIFDIAWKNSEQGKKFYKRRNTVLKSFVCLAAFPLLFLVISGAFATSTYASTEEILELKKNFPNLAYRLKQIFYMHSFHIINIPQSITEDTFFSIVRKYLSEKEFYTFIKAAKDLDISELVNLLTLKL